MKQTYKIYVCECDGNLETILKEIMVGNIEDFTDGAICESCCYMYTCKQKTKPYTVTIEIKKAGK
jgi:hypothetical protein